MERLSVRSNGLHRNLPFHLVLEERSLSGTAPPGPKISLVCRLFTYRFFDLFCGYCGRKRDISTKHTKEENESDEAQGPTFYWSDLWFLWRKRDFPQNTRKKKTKEMKLSGPLFSICFMFLVDVNQIFPQNTRKKKTRSEKEIDKPEHELKNCASALRTYRSAEDRNISKTKPHANKPSGLQASCLLCNSVSYVAYFLNYFFRRSWRSRLRLSTRKEVESSRASGGLIRSLSIQSSRALRTEANQSWAFDTIPVNFP